MSRRETRVDSQGIVRKVRHRAYRAVRRIEWRVQTYRAYVTLECGHTTSYSVTAAKREARQPAKLDCWNCREGQP